uniref:Suf domain-containing protein n=1 Tax=Rhabditophanes sp. KR3021 TaxID=114890 RepID=A0AC35TLN3_9BILA
MEDPIKVQNANLTVIDREDYPFEEAILQNPNEIGRWFKYLTFKSKKAKGRSMLMLYERAVNQFPWSYKLWAQYLAFRKSYLLNKCPTHEAWTNMISIYERCVSYLTKMPKIWVDYCEYMSCTGMLTQGRLVFDRALRALPVTQHRLIWPLYVKFVVQYDIPETAIRVYRRYLKVYPDSLEDFIEYLEQADRLDDAALQLSDLINKTDTVSFKGKTKFELWNQLCRLLANNGTKIHSLDAEAIFRQGFVKYSDQVSILWVSLAKYYLKMGNIEKARDIFEEGLNSVRTVRDFSQIFDGYAKVLENQCARKMESIIKCKPSQQADMQVELELVVSRFESLMGRRDLMLNSVLLRQNPNNAAEWLKRTHLHGNNPKKIVETFEKAVSTVHPNYQIGKLSDIWVAFAKYYIDKQDFKSAIEIFERGLKPAYVKVDDCVAVWCNYIEFELKYFGYERALKLLKRATFTRYASVNYFDDKVTVQDRVFLSLKLWSLYADVEETFGTLETTRKVYDKMMDLKIVNPQVVINYALFLEENNYHEHAFTVYEKGVSLFKWPNVYDIWCIYLTKFLRRYSDKKIERMRDLFEQCIEGITPKYAKNIFVLYAKFEENYGSPRRAMTIYNRAAMIVEKDDQSVIFNIYIKKAMDLFGITHARPVFEQAIEQLPENDSRDISMKYAQLERSLGEIDRARAIYAHCSEVCDPNVYGQFWETWKDFEMKHGNEDTVKVMFRIKRSVQAKFNSNAGYKFGQLLATANIEGNAEDAETMAQIEAQARALVADEVLNQPKTLMSSNDKIMFVRGESNQVQAKTTENPDEIDIEDDEDSNEEEDMEIVEKPVPQAVFGSLSKQ